MSTEVLVNREVSERSAAASGLGWILKTVGMWIVMVMGSVAASKLLPIGLPVPPPDGPLTLMQAFLTVTGGIAVALSLLASKARVRGWRLALMIFVAYFAIGSVMMQIETLYFNESLKLPFDAIMQMIGEAAIVAAIAGVAAALLFRQAPEDVPPVPANLTFRVGAMAIIYVFLYYGFGAALAWSSVAVRTFYENGLHVPLLPTVAFQIFRGTVWALIALYIVTRLKGSLAGKALAMGLLFFTLTSLQLLYPTAFMPWAVRSAHLAEVGSSEFAYGIIATMVLLAGAVRNPIAKSSAWRAVADI